MDISPLPGLYSHKGYWISLSDFSWRRLQPVPFRGIVSMPTTSIRSFGGRATIFGHPTCDDDGVCPLTDVIQYDPASNEWSSVGTLNEPALWYTYIEVPASYCVGLPLLEKKDKMAIERTVETEKEKEEEDDGPSGKDTDTVALIIGGIDYGYDESGPAASTDYVQLYGCPGDHNEVTLFPRRVREAGAIYIPSADGDEEYVLVCGGYQCPRSDPGCLEMSADCFTWFPSTNEWERIDDLELPRRDHIIVNVRICPLHQL